MNWLTSLPKKLLVFLLLAGGVLIIILNDPPKQLCDIQKETFEQDHLEFLFKNPKNKIRTQTVFNENIQACLESNSPGGCYSLFLNTSKLIKSFSAVEISCHKTIAQMKEVRLAFFDSYSLFLEISWGEGPQKDEIPNPLSWLSSNDVTTFCYLKNKMLQLYSIESIENFERQVFKRVAPEKSFKDHQKFSILSENCLRHL